MKKESMTFEQSLKRLEEIVKRMESGDVALEEALALFEEGTALAGSCNKLLDSAELKVLQMTRGADGTPVDTVIEDGTV